MICEESNRHEIQELYGVPQMKVLWVCANEVSADEDVHNTKDKGHLFSGTDNLCVVPSFPELIDTALHLFAVPIELFVSLRDPASPLLNHAIPSRLCLGLDRLPGTPDLVRLR